MRLILGWLLESVVGELGVSRVDTPRIWLQGLRVWATRPAVQSQLGELVPLIRQSLGRVDQTTASRWARQLLPAWKAGKPGLVGRGRVVCQLAAEDDRWLTLQWGATPEFRVARALAGLVWFMSQSLPASRQRPVRDARGRNLMVYPHDRPDRLSGSDLGWERVNQARHYLQTFWQASQEVYGENTWFRQQTEALPAREPSSVLQGVIYRDPHVGIELFALPALKVE